MWCVPKERGTMQEVNILQIVIRELKNQGYLVFYNDYKPDLIGIRGKEAVVIECKGAILRDVAKRDVSLGQCLRYIVSWHLELLHLAFPYDKHNLVDKGAYLNLLRIITFFNLPIRLIRVTTNEILDSFKPLKLNLGSMIKKYQKIG